MGLISILARILAWLTFSLASQSPPGVLQLSLRWVVLDMLSQTLFTLVRLVRWPRAQFAVDGGHRAVIFSRINGVLDTLVGEGLHFR